MKLLHVAAAPAAEGSIKNLAAKYDAVQCYKAGSISDELDLYHIFARPTQRQEFLDELQDVIQSNSSARISILPVDAGIPDVVGKTSTSESREEMVHRIRNGANLDLNFVILAILSSIVAPIGLVEDNVAVVIGAMVIAPFLGPNLALAFYTSQGDTAEIVHAAGTALAGLLIAIAMGAAASLSADLPLQAVEVVRRTSVDLDGVTLAFASGIAGVMSLTAGLSATLVGVMVAVALLPPAAVLGLTLGAGAMDAAAGAGLLLGVNLVCVNLSGLLVFLIKGFAPRTWYERRQAKPHVYGGVAAWTLVLALLIWVVAAR